MTHHALSAPPAGAAPPPLPRVLCVDDEPRVLDGLALHLRRRYDLLTAPNAAEALTVLDRHPDISVVVSDMRMPGMNGAAFLARVRETRPEIVRILLTGHSELESAVAAVNEGQIFRFLTKPCPAPALLAAVGSGVELHRLITAEKVLLEETLSGSVRMLTEVLSITSPAAFGRGTRIKQLVADIADRFPVPQRWQVEVASMLSQLAAIILPAETAEKVYFALPLTEEEQRMVERGPAVADGLLANIPRLEGVREILARVRGERPSRRPGPEEEGIALGAEVLGVAVGFDLLEAQGTEVAQAVDLLRARNRHDRRVIDALRAARAPEAAGDSIREVSLANLRVGMVLAEDIRMVNGSLLAARGFEVGQSFVERAQNFAPGVVVEPVRVVVRPGATDPAS